MPPGAVLHFQNWYVTRLREAVDAAATTIYVNTPPTVTSGILVLEGSNQTKREIIYFASVNGYALEGCVRGLEGTTAQTHNQGASVGMQITAMQAQQLLQSAVQQGMGEDQASAMSQWAIKHTLNQMQQFRFEQDVQPALAFVVSSAQPLPDPDGKIIVWLEPLE